MRKVNSLISASVLASFALTGCSLMPGEKPFDELSDGPGRILQPEEVLDAVPSDEPFAEIGNKSPYSVNGRFYYVMEDPTHYRARGVASWYGKKFHGRKTSSGEVFDMYSMTAAHRNLPLPTYLEVTNLDDGNVAIVRVNDRGPFVDDRLIDLSYAAAVKLGFADAGTANVEVRAITGDEIDAARARAEASAAEVREADGVAALDNASEGAEPLLESAEVAGEQAEEVALATTASVAAQAGSQAAVDDAESTVATESDGAGARVLQLGAFSRQAGAQSVREKALEALPGESVRVLQSDVGGKTLYRVRMGPIARTRLDSAKAALDTAGIAPVTQLPASAAEGDCVAGCE